jgi:hypothetical protein
MPRVYQPDPPGLIHDDPRLLPPWRGSSLLWGKFLAWPSAVYPQIRRYPHVILKIPCATGAAAPRPGTVDP